MELVQWRIVFEGSEKTLRHFSVVLMSPWDILVQRYSVRYFPKRWNHKFARILSFETFPSLSLFFGYSERKEKPFAHFLLFTLWICIPIMSRNFFCILLLIVVFKIRNNEPYRLAGEFSSTIFFVHWNYDLRTKRSCYVAVTLKTVNTRRQLWWRKEKSTRKDERITLPKRQMMLASRIVHIHWVFLYTLFQKM